MEAYRVETVLKQDGTLQLSGLPWQAGSPVEVIVLGQSATPRTGNLYPLRGTPVTYVNPFEPVDDDAWDAAQ